MLKHTTIARKLIQLINDFSSNTMNQLQGMSQKCFDIEAYKDATHM